MRTKNDWIEFLKGALKEIKDDALIYYLNHKILYNQGKVSLDKNLIEFQKALKTLGITAKNFLAFNTLNIK